jgi:non-ribosomal peptide synthetase component F
MLGVMKAGGAFVPLDPTHPTSRLQCLIASVKAAVVLCSPSRAEALRSISNILIPLCAETLEGFSDPVEGVDLASGVTSQNAAYVLFTSGSTGEPKVCFELPSYLKYRKDVENLGETAAGMASTDVGGAGHLVGAPRVLVELHGPWPRIAYFP